MVRPNGVTFLAILTFIGAGFLTLAALLMFVGGALLSNLSSYPQFGTLAGVGGAVIGVLLLGIAALYAILGVGLWKLQNWARILAIVLAALGLLGSIVSLLNPFAHAHFFFFVFLIRRLVGAAIEVWVLFYLFQPHVKQAFGAPSP
jgi:hypothetical protein